MSIIEKIKDAHRQSLTYGSGKLTGREREFLSSIYNQSQRIGFTGLSEKQNQWFQSIAKRLEATQGKLGYEVVAERVRARMQYYRGSYEVACFGR